MRVRRLRRFSDDSQGTRIVLKDKMMSDKMIFDKMMAIEPRIYQQTIFGSCIKGNCLVVLPTGLGKTIIAAMVAAYRIKKFPGSKCIFLAPTRPLVNQHYQTFLSTLNLSEDEFGILTGMVEPEKRRKVWKNSKIIFCTPQILENDIIASRCDLKNVSIIIFDECHRAVGNYSYVFIAERYMVLAENKLILGLTASPGHDREKIEEICRNLFIEKIEIRTESNKDVKPYINPLEIEWRVVPLPESFKRVKKNLEKLLKDRISYLKSQDYLETENLRKISRTTLLEVQKKIRADMNSITPVPPTMYTAIANVASSIRLSYLLELLETQGLSPVKEYFDRLRVKAFKRGASKALKDFFKHNLVIETIKLVNELLDQGITHPKICEVENIITDQLIRNPESRILVFTHFRDSAKKVSEILNQNEKISATRFVGQGSRIGDKGLSQKQQIEILEKFRDGEYNTLIATSVAEEGLDISEVNLVVFYDCVPSAIRNIQRRGRTGRKRPGRVVILIGKGTRDEGYYYASKNREKSMKMIMKELKDISFEFDKKKHQDMEKKLEYFFEKPNEIKETKPLERECHEEKISIVVDNREFMSNVVRELSRIGALEIVPEQLQIGDYVLSSRVCIERKTVKDFLTSLADGKLFDQAKKLVNNYEKPLIILEGEGLYSETGIHPDAVRGALASLTIDFGIPILNTRNYLDTSKLLILIAKREQLEKEKKITIRKDKRTTSLKEIQEFFISGLPGINITLAKRILGEFSTIENFINTDKEKLKEIKGIGETTAEKIKKIVKSEYELDDE